MVGRLRVLLSLVMLGGFYLVALLQLAIAIGLGVWVYSLVHQAVAIKIFIWIIIALVGSVGAALWNALRFKPEPPPGVVIHPDTAPQLWAEVRGLATAAGTRPPDEIRIIPEVNAAVSEHAKLMGLIPGKRYLYIGMPLLQTLTVSQLRSVLGHELGHYSGNHTKLGAVAYRGRLAIQGTIMRIGTGNPIGWAFRGYGRLYLLVDNAVARMQESEADTVAVKVAGNEAAASALRELLVIESAWSFYFARYVGPGAEAGFLPDDLFGGFGELVAARQDELVKLREVEHEVESSVWDTHPPIPDRVRAILAMPRVYQHPDTRLSGDLLPHLGSLGRTLQAAVVEVGGRQVLPWPEFTAAVATANLQEVADRIFRQVGRVIKDRRIGLPAVLGLVESGRAGEIAEPFFPGKTKREARELLYQPVDALITLAAIRSGKASFRHSWAQRAELVGPDGELVDFEELARLAATAETLPQARIRLAELGIEIETTAVVEQVATAKGADVIGGLGNVKIDKVSHDLLILDTGLIFLAGAGDSDEGNKRMHAALGSTPIPELARRHRFLPYEEIAAVKIEKEVPVRATLTLHDGNVVALHETWTGDQLTKQSRDNLLQALRQTTEV
ncbi:Zn-dependent protease with chaperone function [Allocatelliglobosispora scoriae]|uniref:Zn-dependent protease with chaperone function n=1 Tax=Allocatelliglobosispora scoriae TaxID=643052 RepID=A0A841BQ20_9ACTN|nr:M48 family metallopeptidase [Allocatelliglobosispora scoriae]MBB5871167.1 Zn-dependent protease with chaperone function [Allocatelliglobosispora scoriae]